MSNVVTRFAPSPTGYLHLGGARTALFNWLFAKHYAGDMLLRIEDTDHARSSDEAMTAIFEAMAWLGLDFKGEATFQSKNLLEHQKAAFTLLERGAAYRCYLTQEELESHRKTRQALRSPYRNHSDIEDTQQDKPFVIRFKTPNDVTLTLKDHCQGVIEINSSTIEDFALLRSDGTPTYMLSVVCDDHSMNVTDVIRGDDHLTNTFKQTLIYEALDWNVPSWTHVPLIHGDDGKKLSKRHGALSVIEYKHQGYLPEAFLNYLLKLGWSYEDKELFTREEAVQAFTRKGLGRSSARYDLKKLNHINNYHMCRLSTQELLSQVRTFLTDEQAQQWDESSCSPDLVSALCKRSNTLIELRDFLSLYTLPLQLNDSDIKKHLSLDALEWLEALITNLRQQSQENPEASLQSLVKEEFSKVLKTSGLKFPQLGKPLRYALTGSELGLDIPILISAIGLEKTELQLQKVRKTLE